MKTRTRPTWTWLPALTLALGLPLTPGCKNGGQSGDLSHDALGKTNSQPGNTADAGNPKPANGDPEPDATSDDPQAVSTGTSETSPSRESTVGWRKLPEPPLSGRVGAVVGSIGQRVVVVGGWTATCPPFADCVLPDAAPFTDGAMYDLDVGEWSPIADAPIGLRLATTTTAGNALYALSNCGEGPTCPASDTVLRYRGDADEWDELPHPDKSGYFGLIALVDELYAFSRSDESTTVPDYRWSPEDETWTALPDDPLPPVFDRFMVEHGGRIYLFGSPSDFNAEDTKLGARYDSDSDEWEELTPSGTMGYQVWSAGDLLYLNPHFGNSEGGIYDPVSDSWSPWSGLPHHDLAGVIDHDTATYEYDAGWVFDARNDSFVEILARPDSEAYDVTFARAGARGLVVFGGQVWVSDQGTDDPFSGEPLLVNDTWLWTPPDVR